jgi:lipid-binding SYLF domain-containing protein
MPVKLSNLAISALLAVAGAALAHAAPPASPAAGQERGQPATVRHVTEATDVVKRMAAEPRMRALLRDARAVFVVPHYGRAAIGLGASGGAGLLLVRKDDGSWSDPAFFNVGSVGLGLQIGVQTGPLVFILNNDKAVNEFKKKNNFALSADAGLTVVNWTRVAQGTGGAGDIVVWSATAGLFGNAASVNVLDVRFNEKATASYYGQRLNAEQVMAGKVSNAVADPLKAALVSAASPSQ